MTDALHTLDDRIAQLMRQLTPAPLAAELRGLLYARDALLVSPTTKPVQTPRAAAASKAKKDPKAGKSSASTKHSAGSNQARPLRLLIDDAIRANPAGLTLSEVHREVEKLRGGPVNYKSISAMLSEKVKAGELINVNGLYMFPTK
jgi:hypothetical protein